MKDFSNFFLKLLIIVLVCCGLFLIGYNLRESDRYWNAYQEMCETKLGGVYIRKEGLCVRPVLDHPVSLER